MTKKTQKARLNIFIGIALLLIIFMNNPTISGRSSTSTNFIDACQQTGILDLKECAESIASQVESLDLDVAEKINIINILTADITDKTAQVSEQAILIDELNIAKEDQLAAIALLQSESEDAGALIVQLENQLSEEQQAISELQADYDQLDQETKDRLEELSQTETSLVENEVALVNEINQLKSELIPNPFVGVKDPVTGDIDYVRTGGVLLGIFMIFYSLYVIYEQGPDKGIFRKRRRK